MPFGKTSYFTESDTLEQVVLFSLTFVHVKGLKHEVQIVYATCMSVISMYIFIFIINFQQRKLLAWCLYRKQLALLPQIKVVPGE